jgi:hypothetical protein
VSWDIYLQPFPADIVRVEDIPPDFVSDSMGPRHELVDKILAAVPGADFSDPAWGRINLPECEMEVNIGREELVKSVMLHVRGGNLAPGIVAAIADALGVRAIDTGTGEFFDLSAAKESYRRWVSYRDQVMNNASKGNPPTKS